MRGLEMGLVFQPLMRAAHVRIPEKQINDASSVSTVVRLVTISLSTAILKALDPSTVGNAKKIGEALLSDEGAIEGAKNFHDMLDLDNQRCLVSPERVAVARVRRTNIRLSALAAIVLADEGLLKATDLKL